MKKNLLIFALIAISFCGCKKEDAQNTSGHYLSANANNGESFYASGDPVSAGGADGNLYIKASASGGTPEMAITCSGYTGAGKYPFGTTVSTGTYTDMAGIANRAVSGALIITSTVPGIAGTHSFTCAGGFTVSGFFNTNPVLY